MAELKNLKLRGFVIEVSLKEIKDKNDWYLRQDWERVRKGKTPTGEKPRRKNMCREFSVEMEYNTILTLPDDPWNFQLNYLQQNSTISLVWMFFVETRKEAQILQQDRRVKTAGGGGQEQQKTLSYALWHWTGVTFQNQVGCMISSPWHSIQIHRVDV